MLFVHHIFNRFLLGMSDEHTPNFFFPPLYISVLIFLYINGTVSRAYLVNGLHTSPSTILYHGMSMALLVFTSPLSPIDDTYNMLFFCSDYSRQMRAKLLQSSRYFPLLYFLVCNHAALTTHPLFYSYFGSLALAVYQETLVEENRMGATLYLRAEERDGAQREIISVTNAGNGRLYTRAAGFL